MTGGSLGSPGTSDMEAEEQTEEMDQSVDPSADSQMPGSSDSQMTMTVDEQEWEEERRLRGTQVRWPGCWDYTQKGGTRKHDGRANRSPFQSW